MATKKKRIVEAPRTGTETDFIPENYMLIDGPDGSTKIRMSIVGLKSDIDDLADRTYTKTETDTILDDYKKVQDPVSDPTPSGTGLSFISSVSQDAGGEITVAKRTVSDGTTESKGVVRLAGTIGDTVEVENNLAASEKAVRDAIDAKVAETIGSLDVTEVGGAGKYIEAIAEADGKISATGRTMDDSPRKGSSYAITSGAVFDALDALGGTIEIVTMSSTYADIGALVNAGKLPVLKVVSNGEDIYYEFDHKNELGFIFTNVDASTATIRAYCLAPANEWLVSNVPLETTLRKVDTVRPDGEAMDNKYPSEKAVRDAIDDEKGRAMAAEMAATTEVLSGINCHVTKGTSLSDGHATYTISTDVSAEQGTRADTALQGVKVNGSEIAKDGNNKVDLPVPVSYPGNPLMDGTANPGTLPKWARGDHVHPSDTTRESVSNKKQSVNASSETEFPSSKAVATYVSGRIASKADKVSPPGQPMLAAIDTEGNLVSSGKTLGNALDAINAVGSKMSRDSSIGDGTVLVADGTGEARSGGVRISSLVQGDDIVKISYGYVGTDEDTIYFV